MRNTQMDGDKQERYHEYIARMNREIEDDGWITMHPDLFNNKAQKHEDERAVDEMLVAVLEGELDELRERVREISKMHQMSDQVVELNRLVKTFPSTDT